MVVQLTQNRAWNWIAHTDLPNLGVTALRLLHQTPCKKRGRKRPLHLLRSWSIKAWHNGSSRPFPTASGTQFRKASREEIAVDRVTWKFYPKEFCGVLMNEPLLRLNLLLLQKHRAYLHLKEPTSVRQRLLLMHFLVINPIVDEEKGKSNYLEVVVAWTETYLLY